MVSTSTPKASRKEMGYKDDKSKKRSEAGKKGVAKRMGEKESEIANATEL